MRTDLHDTTIKTENAYTLRESAFSFDDWYDHWLNAADAELARALQVPRIKPTAEQLRRFEEIRNHKPRNGD